MSHSDALLVQVDKHKEVLYLEVEGHEDVLLAQQLASKGVQPTHLSLSATDRPRSLAALTTFLAGDQHLPLFKRVTYLWLESVLSHELLQVRAQTGV
jgi:hypothetical protein